MLNTKQYVTKTGKINSAEDNPNQIVLSALPRVLLKNLEIVVVAVWLIKPWPENLNKKIPNANKYISSIKEKNKLDRNSKKITIPEPKHAASGNKKVESINLENIVEPKTIIIEAPKAAPAETPIRPGSARGFLNKPWRQAPDIAKLVPTKQARITLGILISKKIVFSIEVVSPLKREKKEKSKLPFEKAMIKVKIKIIKKIERDVVCLFET